MKKSFVAALILAVLAVLAPAAQAKELQANVVSMQSRLTPGEPVPVVFELYVLEGRGVAANEHPIAGAHDLAVLLTSKGQTERFAASELGGGRYSTEVVFRHAGDWRLAVSVGEHAPMPLGKGGVRLDEASSASGIAFPSYRSCWPEPRCSRSCTFAHAGPDSSSSPRSRIAARIVSSAGR